MSQVQILTLLTLSGSRMLRCTRQTISFTVMSIGTPSGTAQITLSPAAHQTDRQKVPIILEGGANGANCIFCVRPHLLHSKHMILQSVLSLANSGSRLLNPLRSVFWLAITLILYPLAKNLHEPPHLLTKRQKTKKQKWQIRIYELSLFLLESKSPFLVFTTKEAEKGMMCLSLKNFKWMLKFETEFFQSLISLK